MCKFSNVFKYYHQSSTQPLWAWSGPGVWTLESVPVSPGEGKHFSVWDRTCEPLSIVNTPVSCVRKGPLAYVGKLAIAYTHLVQAKTH